MAVFITACSEPTSQRQVNVGLQSEPEEVSSDVSEQVIEEPVRSDKNSAFEQAAPPTQVVDANVRVQESVLSSLSRLSISQEAGLEINNISELEKLSETDRQKLQSQTAEQTMAAAVREAAQQIDKTERNKLAERSTRN